MSAGKAALFVSTAVAGGFGVLMLSWDFYMHLWMGLLISLAMLFSAQRFFAFSQLGGALFGYIYIKMAPRRGFAFAGSKRFFGVRNSYYRWKRRRAARKFEVYMRKQNRDVHFDKDGKYINPDEDPKDRRWMN